MAIRMLAIELIGRFGFLRSSSTPWTADLPTGAGGSDRQSPEGLALGNYVVANIGVRYSLLQGARIFRAFTGSRKALA